MSETDEAFRRGYRAAMALVEGYAKGYGYDAVAPRDSTERVIKAIVNLLRVGRPR